MKAGLRSSRIDRRSKILRLRSGRLRAHACGGVLGGCYTTNDLTTHLTTNIETIKKFLPVDFKTEHEDGIYRISCAPV